MAVCPRCGKEVTSAVVVCNYCGASLDRVPISYEPSLWGVAPRGVSIMGWVQELMGIGGAALGAVGLLVGLGVSSLGILLLGGLLLSAGVALFYLGFALRRARQWAWRYDIIVLAIISAGGVISFFLGLYPIAVWLLVFVFAMFIYYLLTPGVRQFFGGLDTIPDSQNR